MHGLARGRAARQRAVALLDRVRVPEPHRRAREYPHQLSGGLKQRAMLALAIAAEPRLLIADEPTTALDATVQAEILDLLREMRRAMNLSLLLITHDFGVLAELADRVIVLQAGRVVEEGAADRIFDSPQSPYTRHLLDCVPGLYDGSASRARRAPLRYAMTPLLEIQHLVKEFPHQRGWFGSTGRFRAVDDVTFSIASGETFGLVGESGSGKTTIGRCALRLIEPTAGTIRFQGADLLRLSRGDLRRTRRHMQIVFQDPYSSLNPRMRVGDIIAEPLVIHRAGTSTERTARVRELMDLVGLNPAHAGRRPDSFSGGQRQRIGIARALALHPSFIVADEPVSALDVSVQAQVIDLLLSLQRRLGLTYLFIAHDLRLVRATCTRVGVMYRGRLIEVAPAESLFARPTHPYTQALLSAVPRLHPFDAVTRIAFDDARYVPRALRELEPDHFAAV